MWPESLLRRSEDEGSIEKAEVLKSVRVTRTDGTETLVPTRRHLTHRDQFRLRHLTPNSC